MTRTSPPVSGRFPGSALGLACLLAACGGSTEPTPAQIPDATPSAAPTPTPDAASTGTPAGGATPTRAPTPSAQSGATPSEPGGAAVVTPVGDGGELSHPDVELPPQSAGTRRLTVAQLRASVAVILGDDASGAPITWTVPVRGKQVEALTEEVLGGTLGEANYVDVTFEAADPSTLYLKLMDDLARDVCAKRVAADWAIPGQGDRGLVRYASLTALSGAEVDANLRYLSLRYLGVKVAEGDAASIADLRALFDAVVATAPGSDSDRARAGWQGVCIGLILDPAFHIY